MITVITINYNNAPGLRKTLESVSSQTSKSFEYIIVDGASSDGSEDIIRNFHIKSDLKCRFVSEADTGIYNAMNKGLGLASRDYVLFLNSGDMFNSIFTISEICSTLETYDFPTALYGDIIFVDSINKVKRKWVSGSFVRYKFLLGWMLPHPGTAIKLREIEKLGLFDESYHIAADYDLIYRLFYVEKLDAVYLSKALVRMEEGGVSNGSLLNVIRGNLEVLSAWRKQSKFIPIWIFLLKPLSKIFQYLRK